MTQEPKIKFYSSTFKGLINKVVLEIPTEAYLRTLKGDLSDIPVFDEAKSVANQMYDDGEITKTELRNTLDYIKSHEDDFMELHRMGARARNGKIENPSEKLNGFVPACMYNTYVEKILEVK